MQIIVLILLTLSGGLSYIAKSALPGDMLYPVKTGIDEPIEEALAFGPEAKSAVHVSHALERLSEIAQLQSAGKLSHRDEVFTKFAFENELSKVNADIETLNTIKNYRVAREVEKTMREGMQRSPVLATLYGNQQATSSDKNIADGALVEGQQDRPTTPTTAPVLSSTTKYVPKLLPPRNNISRGDDNEEEDD